MLDQTFEHHWERLENFVLYRHGATSLEELTTSNLLVTILKNVELHLDVQQIEHGLISEFYPFDYVIEIFHGLSVEFVKTKFVKKSI